MKQKIKYTLPVIVFMMFSQVHGQHFQPVWNTPFNPMTVIVVGATINGEALQTGDEIGIFDVDPNIMEEICVGATTVQGIISPENFLEIICSMDDGTLAGQSNGFTAGNNFIFRFWSQNTGEIEEVNIGFPYTGYDEVFTALGTAIVDLTAFIGPIPVQSIQLEEGWAGISTYLIPENTDIVQLMNPIQDDLIILNNLDGFYLPPTANTLGSWDYKSGYMIKTTAATQLDIEGSFAADKTLTLNSGWNIIPVLSQSPVDISTLFSGQIAKVGIIKEIAGTHVFWPEKNIQSLLDLQPGKAYLVSVTEEIVVTFDQLDVGD